MHSPATGALELVRVAAGAVTHRRALGGVARAALALGSRGVLVATTTQDLRRMDLATFARADLAPGPHTALPEPGGVELLGIWPGPGDRVAVAARTDLPGIGRTLVAHPRRAPPFSRPRREPCATLRLWTPATSAVSAAQPLCADPRASAWLGATFVVVAGAETSVGPHGPVLERAGRVLRFDVVP